jgi:methionine-gamma-lyase
MLEEHPKVRWVRYPGLSSHPARELVKRQMDGPGALLSLELKGGYEAGRTVMDNVKLMTLAVSLGGVETLIQHPASMTHAGMTREARQHAGITDGLVRLSIGCEDLEDLRIDLAQALDRVCIHSGSSRATISTGQAGPRSGLSDGGSDER